MGGTSRDLIGDGWLSERAIYRTDLDACQPADALYRGSRARHWRLLSYELEGLAGTMVRADEETAAPELTYALRASGYHAVSLGLMAESSEDVVVLARLSGDASATVITCPVTDRPGRHRIRELFWKIADLSGQDLVIGQQNRRIAAGSAPGCVLGSPVRLAYVKLVPLTEAEVASYRADAARRDTRRLYGHNDAHGLHYATRPTEADHIRRRIEMFRNTDFSRLYWECGMGDLLYYLGTAGRLPTLDGLDDFARTGDRLHRESWQILREQGIDPFRVAREHAHDMGLEFHATYRPAGFRFPPDHDHFDHGDSVYVRHPELRGRDRDGRETPRISYAYPESRRFAVSLLTEVATDYDVDGICLAYNRRPPFSEFEPPLIDSFAAQHGRDPRTLPDDDETWLSHRCGVLTSFMREVRAALDEVARSGRRGRIPVTAIVMRDAAENLYYGMDLQTWVREGLVDTLIPYTSAVFLDSAADSWVDPRGADWFVELTRGTGCALSMSLLPRMMPPAVYRERAAGLYRAGVESFFFWDCTPGRGNYTESWSALRRLGHKDEVLAWTEAGTPDLGVVRRPLTSLDGWDLSYATPG